MGNINVAEREQQRNIHRSHLREKDPVLTMFYRLEPDMQNYLLRIGKEYCKNDQVYALELKVQFQPHDRFVYYTTIHEHPYYFEEVEEIIAFAKKLERPFIILQSETNSVYIHFVYNAIVNLPSPP